MMSLRNSSRFQNEYKTFETKINEIPNETVKQQGKELLQRLLAEVKKIDISHNEIMSGKSLPDTVDDSKSRIIEIRKKLDKIVKDWDAVKAQ